MSPQKKRRWIVFGVITAAFLALYFAGQAALGFEDIDPAPGSASGDPSALLDGVLRRFVHEGQVDYRGLAAHPEGLEAAARAFARRPNGWTHKGPLINAYNTFVLLGVIRHWPIGSVHEVRGWIEPTEGFGFFYAQHFLLEEERINLFDLEGTIRGLDDPRIHAALNCASASCPALRAEAYAADEARLEAQLEEATRAFASDPPHVVIDEDGRRIRLSMIYAWYPEDFGGDRGEEGVLDFIAEHARPEVAEALTSARRGGFGVEYAPYDWSLNGR